MLPSNNGSPKQMENDARCFKIESQVTKYSEQVQKGHIENHTFL